MAATFRVSFPMRWISLAMVEWRGACAMIGLSFGLSFGLSLVAFMPPMSAQVAEARFTLEGLENRPFRLTEFHPLGMTTTTLAEGQVSMRGEVDIQWPDDGRLHFVSLHCAGVVWSLPVCGPHVGEVDLVVPGPGRAPFAERPGILASGADVGGQRWAPVIVAEAQSCVDDAREAMAADLQQAMLWGAGSGSARRDAGAVLGASIGGAEGQEEGAVGGGDGGAAAVADSLLMMHGADFMSRFEGVLEGAGEEALNGYLQTMVVDVMGELEPRLRREQVDRWRSSPAPDPLDAAAVTAFRAGLDLVAHADGWTEEEVKAFSGAITTGDLEGLTASTASWWGTEDVDRTIAWFIARMGDGGLGAFPPTRFATGRIVPRPWLELLAGFHDHPTYGAEAKRLSERFTPPGPLPGGLRAFDAGGDLQKLEDLVANGPAVWLWIDAGAPTTVVQLQVLEKTLAMAMGNRRGDGPSLPRDLRWVVIDAGQDWQAFERLVRAASARNGGLSRLPYALMHSGGDLRWTEAFEIRALPAVRHHGPGLAPTPEEPPLPGPDLIRWLARRS